MPVPPKQLLGQLQQLIPFNKFLGIEIEDARDGWAKLTLPYRPEFIGDAMRPALHGGVISTLIDVCGGFAVWTTIRLEDRISTIDLRVDYLSPGLTEPLVAEGSVVRTGNRVGVVDVRVYHPATPDKTIATGKAVYNIKRKEDAP